MMRSAFILVVCVGTLGCGPGAEAPVVSLPRGPTVNSNLTEYDVRGRSLEDVWNQMKTVGPEDHTGVRRPARTDWRVRWSMDTRSGSNGCEISNIEVSLNVQVSMPRWSNASSASADLQARWERFIRALDRHEQGHVQDAEQARDDIDAFFRMDHDFEECDALLQHLERHASDTVEMYQRKSIEYDNRTDHGRTMGASL